MLDWVRRGETEVQPIFIHDYLDQFGAHGEVTVRTGAWNTGWHHGADFQQWTGSAAQQAALKSIHDFSGELLASLARADTAKADLAIVTKEIEEARWRLLRAETSCNLFWGEAWVHRIHDDLKDAEKFLENARCRCPALR
jgi:alpha-amylase/alpha-mannosidase (GH57 family)